MLEHQKNDKFFSTNLTVLLGLLAILCTGCWNSENSSQVDTLRYNPQGINHETAAGQRWANAYKIIATHCLSCHKEYGTTDEQEYISMGVVLPGVLSQSPIYYSIKGAGGSQDEESMPPEELLKDADILTIKTWVENLR